MKAQIDKRNDTMRILLKAETPQDVEDLIDIKERSEELCPFFFSYEVGNELVFVSANATSYLDDLQSAIRHAEEGMMVALGLGKTSLTPEIMEAFKKLASEKNNE